MKLVFDTNRYSDADRGDADAALKLRTAEQIFLPVIVLAELRAGFLRGSRIAENERRLQKWLAVPRVTVLAPDEGTTHTYAKLVQQLYQQGTPIPTNDIWIAALTLQHGFTLYARDMHFDHLPQLPRV